jgi:hypothetical protein
VRTRVGAARASHHDLAFSGYFDDFLALARAG